MNNQTFKEPLSWSIGSIVVILIFSIYAFMTIVSTFFLQSGSANNLNQTDSLVEKYNKQVAMDIARFNGRSAFYIPIRIARPAPPAPKKEEVIPEPEPRVIPEEPKPIPPPATYTGPPLIAIFGQEAWFRGSGSGVSGVIRLKVGEEQDGLKLIETTPPLIATVEHRRGKYPIHLFEDKEPFFRQDPAPVASDSFLEEVDG